MSEQPSAASPHLAFGDLSDAATSAYDALENHIAASKPKAVDPGLHQMEGVRLLPRLIVHTAEGALRATPSAQSNSNARRPPAGQLPACPACGMAAESGSHATA